MCACLCFIGVTTHPLLLIHHTLLHTLYSVLRHIFSVATLFHTLIGYWCRQKGELDAPNDPADKAPNVFGNSRKIPPRITAIAHHVRKAGGKPRMLLLPLGALSIYRAFFSDRVHEVKVPWFESSKGWDLSLRWRLRMLYF